MSTKLFFLFFALSTLFIVGCTKHPTSPPAGGVPFLGQSIAWNPATSPYGYLSCVTWRKETIGATSYLDDFITQAVFYDSTGTPIMPGAVSLDGITLPAPSGRKDIHISSAVDFTSAQVWNVSSATGIPAINDSITPPSQFRISYPAHLTDTASISSLTITYSNPGVDSVYILLKYDSVISVSMDSSLHYSPIQSYTKTVNSGSFSVPSWMLTGFPSAGAYRVFVVADNAKQIFAGGHLYIMRSSTAATSFFHVKP